MEDTPTLKWEANQLHLLDQRVLPQQVSYVICSSAGETAEAIRNMVVRGAPAIGIAAAYGVALAAGEIRNQGLEVNSQNLSPAFNLLAQSRPTAVNLFQALERMKTSLTRISPSENPVGVLVQEAANIHKEDSAACQAMGEIGSQYIKPESTVYTHCNAGALATGGIGTALGVITTAHSKGLIALALADETRPWMQGSRLTAWELQRAGVPFRLAVEGAAAGLMRKYGVHWVIVGADRIAANGDVANKVGTYPLCIAAKYHGAKVMVVAPTTTIDWEAPSGEAIPIETRSPEEITHFKGYPLAPEGTLAENPVFDWTPAELVDVIVTEAGAVEKPDRQKLAAVRRSLVA